MKKNSIYIVGIAIALLGVGGCAKKNNSGAEAMASYREALTDSISSLQESVDSCRTAASNLSDEVNGLLRDFVSVNKSREVAGYTIFQGWENKYPLTSTGLIARMTEEGNLELIAALSGGVFDRITVTSGTETAGTDVVPNDQALNYRREGLTTVMFSGTAADSVGQLIMNNELNPIEVTYLNGGKATGTYRLPHGNAKMISMTALLTSRNAEHLRVERRGMLLTERIKLLRRHLEEYNWKDNQKEESK